MNLRSLFHRAVACMLVLLLEVSTVWAQGRPALFLHGLQSEGSDWAATATRLQDQFAIQAMTPNLQWRQEFERQALTLAQSDLVRSFRANPVAIGHSNGGIVARELSRLRPVSAIATIGTPHRGAPILPRFGQWMSFQSNTSSLLNEVLSAFSSFSDASWILGYVAGALSWASDFGIWSVLYLAVSLGIDAAMPVALEMNPGSSYLSALNSSENLQREAAEVPARVGLVSVAHNFYWAGPARAITPEHADEIATALYATAFGLLYWSSYALVSSDFDDLSALRQSTSLLGLGGFLLTIDPYYCSLVSGHSFGDCTPNDGVLPFTSQEYPDAPNVYLGLDNDGPAHSQEKDWSESVLRDALTWYMHVPPRGTPDPTPLPMPDPITEPMPEPPPTPMPEPEPVVDPPQAAPPPPVSDAPPSGARCPAPSDAAGLSPGEVLYANQSIHSADGCYGLVYQGDGNLVLYDQSGTPLWHTGTYGTDPGVVAMQGDGNLVMYDAAGNVPWASMDSLGHPGAGLVLQNDGNLVIYDVDGTALWHTDTWRR